jgi:hypothetical protein
VVHASTGPLQARGSSRACQRPRRAGRPGRTEPGASTAPRAGDAAARTTWTITARSRPGRDADTPWDPDLAEAMRERGCGVHEEAYLTALLEDLRAE